MTATGAVIDGDNEIIRCVTERSIFKVIPSAVQLWTGAMDVPASAAEQLQAEIEDVAGDVSDHVSNSDIHVTAAKKAEWDAKQDALTFDDTPTSASNNPVKSGGIYNALVGKQDALTFEDTVIWSSPNPVKSSGIYTFVMNGLLTKQNILTFDTVPTYQSYNPIYSGGVYSALLGKQNTLTFDDSPVDGSLNPVKSGGIYSALAGKQDTMTLDNTPTFGSQNPITSNGVFRQIDASEQNLTLKRSGKFNLSVGIKSIAYGNGKFVAVGDINTGSGSTVANNTAYYSADGVTWTAATFPESKKWTGVAFGGDKFVAVSSNGTICYSADGIAWSTASNPAPNATDVCYGNGVFVAVGGHSAYYSANGFNWSEVSLKNPDGTSISLLGPNAVAIAYGGGKFVITYNVTSSSYASYVSYSADGVNWTTTTIEDDNDNWIKVAYGNGVYLTCSYETNKVAISTDGANWDVRIAFQGTAYIRDLVFWNGAFVLLYATDDTLKVAISYNGASWDTDDIFADAPSLYEFTGYALGAGEDQIVALAQTVDGYKLVGMNYVVSQFIKQYLPYIRDELYYSRDFQTSDWSSQKLTVNAATHKCGTAPLVQVYRLTPDGYESGSSDYDDVIISLAANGDVTLSTTTVFSGRIVIR